MYIFQMVGVNAEFLIYLSPATLSSFFVPSQARGLTELNDSTTDNLRGGAIHTPRSICT